MRKIALAVLGSLTLVLLAWAGDPWKDKPFQQWTDKDIAQVLSASPWAKTNVVAEAAWRPLDSVAVTGSTPGNVAGSQSDTSKVAQGSLNEQRGGLEKNAGGGLQSYNVFWWSSRTIRAAVARRAVIHNGKDPAEAQNFVNAPREEYEILVQGQDMSVFEQRGEKAFEDAAYLQIKKTKQKIAPSHISFNRAADGQKVMGAVFYFSKKDKGGNLIMAADEKEVDFYLKIAEATLRTYFEPKKMVDGQGEDL